MLGQTRTSVGWSHISYDTGAKKKSNLIILYHRYKRGNHISRKREATGLGVCYLRSKQLYDCWKYLPFAFYPNQAINSFLTPLKFIYSEKVTKFCKISTKYLSYGLPFKELVEILQNFVAFSEYMNIMVGLLFLNNALKWRTTNLKCF